MSAPTLFEGASPDPWLVMRKYIFELKQANGEASAGFWLERAERWAVIAWLDRFYEGGPERFLAERDLPDLAALVPWTSDRVEMAAEAARGVRTEEWGTANPYARRIWREVAEETLRAWLDPACAREKLAKAYAASSEPSA